MTPSEVARVLAKASAFDQRTVGAADVAAWHEILHRVELADALDAVRDHYTGSTDRLMPADVVRLARLSRDERRRRQRVSAVLALPSRFEADQERDERLERGLALCVEAIAPVLAELARRREASFSPTLLGCACRPAGEHKTITEEKP